MPPPAPPSPIILIISGPAGSGKTTLCDRLLAEHPDRIRRVVTTTTRTPRPGEEEGVDYYFLDSATFEKRLAEGAFIEWARVHGRYYGSQKAHVRGQLDTGRDLLLNIDVQGARSFQAEAARNTALPENLHTVFIRPRSLGQIRERLLNRGESIEEIERRLKTAATELEQAGAFQHIIVSGSREEDYAALRGLYCSLKKESTP